MHHIYLITLQQKIYITHKYLVLPNISQKIILLHSVHAWHNHRTLITFYFETETEKVVYLFERPVQ